MENTQIEILSTDIIDKTKAAEVSQMVISSIQNGERSALDWKLKFAAIENVIKTVKPIMDKAARDEAELEGKKTFTKNGAIISLKEFGMKYDYSNCNWPKLNELYKMMEKLKGQIENEQDKLKLVNGSDCWLDNSTGEVVTVYPPIKTSTSGIEIKL